MSAPANAAAACELAADHCITCGDEGIPMRVLEIRPDGIAVCVDGDHRRHDVATELVGAPAGGDTVIVHAGVAIAHLQAAPR